MNYICDSGARYHTQDEDGYCGAACTMMLLAPRKVSYTQLKQKDLIQGAHDSDPGSTWSMSPQGMKTLLNTPFHDQYKVYNHDNPESINTDIVNSLYACKQPVVVLTKSCQHWVVVTAFQTTQSPDMAGWEFCGVKINDPIPYTPSDGHSDHDECPARFGTSDWIGYDWWKYVYLTGFSLDGVNKQYIMVGRVYDDNSSRVYSQPFLAKASEKFTAGTEIIPRPKVGDYVRQALLSENLDADKDAADAIRNGKPGTAELVHYSNRPGLDYYLIPLESDRGVLGIVSLDAHFGSFRGLRIFHQPSRKWRIDLDAAHKAFTNKSFKASGIRQNFTLNSKEIQGIQLVWKPSARSFSPFEPLYEVTLKSQQVHFRLDLNSNEVFLNLDPATCGS